MNLKKNIIIVFLIVFFCFCTRIDAACYKHCINDNLCNYSKECNTENCELVNDSFCGYNNYDKKQIVSCGDNFIKQIPSIIPKVVSTIYIVIQIAVPVLLVIMGSLDLAKGITAQKDDEIKKSQQLFVKRLISAAIVFFVFVAVKFVISLVADSTSNRILDCASCFIENNCD